MCGVYLITRGELQVRSAVSSPTPVAVPASTVSSGISGGGGRGVGGGGILPALPHLPAAVPGQRPALPTFIRREAGPGCDQGPAVMGPKEGLMTGVELAAL